MMKKKKIAVVVSGVVFVVLLIGAVVSYNYLSKQYTTEKNVQNENMPSSQNREKAPDFTVVNSGGEKVKLSDFKGKPVVVNFWATWCPPCKAELPAFDSLCKKYDGKVQFMMVNLTDGIRETKEVAGSFISDNGYGFPVFYDTQNNASTTYSVHSVPLSVFVDESGGIVASHIGSMSESTLENYIKLLLGD